MGAKFSKSGKGDKCIDDPVDESSDTFDKTSTLPATFKKKDEEVTKAGTLPRGGLDRSTSFSKRFRKSMTRLVGHKKGNDNAEHSIEPNEPKAEKKNKEEEEKNEIKCETLQEVVESPEETEEDLKTTQLKARAQFFEEMYSPGERVNIPKPPRTNIPSPVENIKEEEEAESVSVSVIGTPVTAVNIEVKQETPQFNTVDTDVPVVEVVEQIVNTKQEMVTLTGSKQAEVPDQVEVQLVNDKSNVTELIEEKVPETVTVKSDTINEVIVTGTSNNELSNQNVAVFHESEHTDKIECEDNHENIKNSCIIEGVNIINEVGKIEPTIEESISESYKEIREEELNLGKSDAEKDISDIVNECPPEENIEYLHAEKQELDECKEELENEESLQELEQNTHFNQEDGIEHETDLILTAKENEEKRDEKEITSEDETFEIVTRDMLSDVEKSGASSLESQCDSQIDDLKSEGGSEGGITTDEGIVASDDEEKDSENDPKMHISDITEEHESPSLLTAQAVEVSKGQ